MTLPAKTQTDFANYLECMARDIRYRVKLDAERANSISAVAKHRQKLIDGKAVLKARLWQGIAPQRAISMTAHESGINKDWLQLWVNQSHAKIARSKRDRAIMQKMARGWTNAKIGEYYDLHPKSIARIVSEYRKKYS